MNTSMREHKRTDPAGESARAPRVVMADDDRNDHLLFLMAAEAAEFAADFTFVDDGSKLMFHLARFDNVEDLPDLIVLDLRMPGLDGHRTLDELQAHPAFWQIPVVVFTSSTRMVDEIRSLDRGARWFETKPSEFDDLVGFVRSLASRADHPPYTLDDEALCADENSPRLRLSALAADTISEIEDQLMSEGKVGLLSDDEFGGDCDPAA